MSYQIMEKKNYKKDEMLHKGKTDAYRINMCHFGLYPAGPACAELSSCAPTPFRLGMPVQNFPV